MEDLQKTKTLTIEGGGLAALVTRARTAFSLGYRKDWREASVNRRIFAAMMTVGALTAAVKLIATLKEVIVAHQFGVGDGLDAFLIAYLLPSFAINVVSGSFNAALIPTYIQVREREGEQAAQELFSSVMIWSAALLLVVSILMAAAAPFLLSVLASGFSAEKLALTRSLFFLLLPTLPLSGVFVVWAAVLNAGERFALAAITPVMTPIAVIIIVYEFSSSIGIYAFALAVFVGAIVEGSLLARALGKQGTSVIPRWHGLTKATRQVMRQYAPMIAGSFIMSSTGLVDQAMAAMLGSGCVSTLSYGNKVSAVVVSIGAIAVSTAILPQFSRMAASEDWASVRTTLKLYMRLILSITVPLTVGLILFSEMIVRLLFQRGAFTANSTAQVASVQSFYLLQLPFYVSGMLFVRLISALKANHVLMIGTIISFSLNISLDYLFMKWFGVAGIALSTSVVYLASLCFLSFMAMHLLGRAEKCG